MLVDPGTGRLLRAGDLWDDGARPDGFVIAHSDGSPRPYDAAEPLDSPDLVELRRPAAVRLRNGQAITYRSVFALLAEAAQTYTPERVAEITWLSAAEVGAFNALFSGSPKLAYHSWTGVGQHTNATATERAIATLYALTGACDKAGGNLWPVPPPTRSVNDYVLQDLSRRSDLLCAV